MGAPEAFTQTSDVTHWIAGRPWPSSGNRRQTVWNPATGRAAREVCLAEPADVDAAVAAAVAAQPAWGDMPPIRRARVLNRFLALLNEHRDQLACVVLDLLPHRVGLKPASKAFVNAIREWTSRNGALLVLDEVITFRTEYGGAQQAYGIHGDLTALGKMIGGGFPVGALAGKAEFMEVLNPAAPKLLFPLSGTFSANPVTMTAGRVAMEHFDRAAVARLNALGDRVRHGIAEAIARTGACASVTGGGSMFRVHMKAQVPSNYREAYTTPEENKRLKLMLEHLFAEGFLMVGTCTGMLSTPMTEREIDALVAAMESGFRRIAKV